MKYVDRSVTIPIQDQPACGTVVDADTQIFGNHGSAAAAFLACAPGVAEDCAPTSFFRFVGDHPLQFTPGRQANVPPQASESACEHALNVQVFKHDHIALVDEPSGNDIELGLAGPGQIEPSAGNDLTCLFTAVRTFLLTGEGFLRTPQSALGPDGGTDIAHDLPVGSGDEIGQSEIDPDLAASGRKRDDSHLGADKARIPTVSLAGDSDPLGSTRQFPVGHNAHPADADHLETGFPLVVPPSIGLEFQTTIPSPAFESGIAWLFACANAAEKTTEGAVEPLESGVKDATVNPSVFGQLTPEVFDFHRLIEVTQTLASVAIDLATLLKRGVVEIAREIKPVLERFDLAFGRLDTELVGSRECHNTLILNGE